MYSTAVTRANAARPANFTGKRIANPNSKVKNEKGGQELPELGPSPNRLGIADCGDEFDDAVYHPACAQDPNWPSRLAA
jgi:hypothetical protein